jgi:hypothetical protein
MSPALPCTLDWLIDYDGLRLCLSTAATNGPIVHPPGDMLAWSAVVVVVVMMVMVPAGDNSWLVHQSSLAVLPADIWGKYEEWTMEWKILPFQYLRYLTGSLTRRKILRHRTSGFTSHPKESVLRIFIALKNPSPRLGLNPRPLGPVANTLTTTLPRRFSCTYWRNKFKLL